MIKHYDIDDDNVLRAYALQEKEDGTFEPVMILFQDVHPDGREWYDRAEVEAWAEANLTLADDEAAE
jgi:hypothetical protein